MFGPQCSLWLTYMSQPTHKRRSMGILGDYCQSGLTFLANLVNENTATYLVVLYCRQVAWVLEQPSGTYYMEYPCTKWLINILGVDQVHTWMKCFNHWMPKPTKLIGTLVGLGGLLRVYSKRRWDKRRKNLRERLRAMNTNFRRRLASRSWAKRRHGKEAWKSTKKSSGSGNWVSGGKHLKGSGAYTPLFCDTILNQWQQYRFELAEPLFNIEELLENVPFPMHDHGCPKKHNEPAAAAVTCIPSIPASWSVGPSFGYLAGRENLTCMSHECIAFWDQGIPRCFDCEIAAEKPRWPSCGGDSSQRTLATPAASTSQPVVATSTGSSSTLVDISAASAAPTQPAVATAAASTAHAVTTLAKSEASSSAFTVATSVGPATYTITSAVSHPYYISRAHANLQLDAQFCSTVSFM
jgi:hypothetical protein